MLFVSLVDFRVKGTSEWFLLVFFFLFFFSMQLDT